MQPATGLGTMPKATATKHVSQLGANHDFVIGGFTGL
jgi:hypothetical protein